jgi:hypothetical protein
MSQHAPDCNCSDCTDSEQTEITIAMTFSVLVGGHVRPPLDQIGEEIMAALEELSRCNYETLNGYFKIKEYEHLDLMDGEEPAVADYEIQELT